MDRQPSPEDHDAQHEQGVTLVTPPICGGAPEIVVESLPLETTFLPLRLRQYDGFWLSEQMLSIGLPAVYTRFTPRPSDMILASFPKSGTTWLKALAFATLNRATHSPSDVDRHPLCHSNPHETIKFIDLDFTYAESVEVFSDKLEALPSPRLLATHLPYSLLPPRIREACRIVCISREPKDTLVSWWSFVKKEAPALKRDVMALTFQDVFDLFCLEYWEESVRKPDKVLFLRYEKMLLDPRAELKKLAKFMGCEFSMEEKEQGVVDAIVELCSLGKLKNMEVNRNGKLSGKLAIENASFFRQGVVGDWSKHMTPEMARRLDKMVEDFAARFWVQLQRFISVSWCSHGCCGWKWPGRNSILCVYS